MLSSVSPHSDCWEVCLSVICGRLFTRLLLFSACFGVALVRGVLPQEKKCVFQETTLRYRQIVPQNIRKFRINISKTTSLSLFRFVTQLETF